MSLPLVQGGVCKCYQAKPASLPFTKKTPLTDKDRIRSGCNRMKKNIHNQKDVDEYSKQFKGKFSFSLAWSYKIPLKSTLPGSLTVRHRKFGPRKEGILFQPLIFRCYVEVRGCTLSTWNIRPILPWEALDLSPDWPGSYIYSISSKTGTGFSIKLTQQLKMSSKAKTKTTPA